MSWFGKNRNSSKIRFTIEYDADNGLTSFVSWPKATTDEEKIALIRNLATISSMFEGCTMYPLINDGLSVAGVRLDQSEIARGALCLAQEAVNQQRATEQEGEADRSQTVVPATRTFRVRYRSDGSVGL